MPFEFRLPDTGEGIHEAEIIEVLVSPGDAVEDGQPVLVVETDKANIEIPSPVTGVVKEIKVKAGDIARVGDVVMIFEAASETEKADAAKKGESEAGKTTVEAEPAEGTAGPERVGKGASSGRKASGKGPVPATPSTRRLARELKVDLHAVTPGGPGGRVTAEDVRRFAEKGETDQAAGIKADAGGRQAPAAGKEPAALPDFSRWGRVERIPLRSIRRATARQMTLAWEHIPHVVHQDIADITELEAFRAENKSEIEQQGGSLTLTIFALKAAAASLKAYPRFNAALDSTAEEIILKKYYDINVAVDTERGLLTPVVRGVDCKSMIELAVELPKLTERTRAGGMERDEMLGGTFTITNIGSLGGTGFAPMINYPQTAILGMARARLQPVVQGNIGKYEIIPRLILPLVLAFDHRVVDGADAARFLNRIVDLFEHPRKLMLV